MPPPAWKRISVYGKRYGVFLISASQSPAKGMCEPRVSPAALRQTEQQHNVETLDFIAEQRRLVVVSTPN